LTQHVYVKKHWKSIVIKIHSLNNNENWYACKSSKSLCRYSRDKNIPQTNKIAPNRNPQIQAFNLVSFHVLQNNIIGFMFLTKILQKCKYINIHIHEMHSKTSVQIQALKPYLNNHTWATSYLPGLSLWINLTQLQQKYSTKNVTRIPCNKTPFVVWCLKTIKSLWTSPAEFGNWLVVKKCYNKFK